jgi:hypothetical protein
VTRAEIVPVSLAQARRYVADHHRHNEPPIGHKFSIGLERDGELVGVVMAGRPVARGADDGRTLELIRLTTEGDRNACSRLYSAACRAGEAMGYRRVITYTLQSERGTSLLAAGFAAEAVTNGGTWAPMEGVHRQAEHPRLFDPPKMPTEPKVRWSVTSTSLTEGWSQRLHHTSDRTVERCSQTGQRVASRSAWSPLT